ncbi:MAG: hypothetical protein JW888_06780 [Pirellulales bacterium]|nr:hypothetical protein [Pirellulales bacterium]
MKVWTCRLCGCEYTTYGLPTDSTVRCDECRQRPWPRGKRIEPTEPSVELARLATEEPHDVYDKGTFRNRLFF